MEMDNVVERNKDEFIEKGIEIAKHKYGRF